MMHDTVLETSRYPEISFQSTNITVTRIVVGLYKARIIGELTMHGVTRGNLWIQAQVKVEDDSIRAQGDFTLKQINVLARTNVRCAEDNYIEGQELIVFLEPEDSLFHTANYQYGQFPIVNEIVKGWRDPNNKPIDKPYVEVRQEILAYVNATHNPKPETPPQQPPVPVKPPLD